MTRLLVVLVAVLACTYRGYATVLTPQRFLCLKEPVAGLPLLKEPVANLVILSCAPLSLMSDVKLIII